MNINTKHIVYSKYSIQNKFTYLKLITKLTNNKHIKNSAKKLILEKYLFIKHKYVGSLIMDFEFELKKCQ